MWLTNIVPHLKRKQTFDIFVGTFTDDSPATHPVLPPVVGAVANDVEDSMCIPLPSEGNLT